MMLCMKFITVNTTERNCISVKEVPRFIRGDVSVQPLPNLAHVLVHSTRGQYKVYSEWDPWGRWVHRLTWRFSYVDVAPLSLREVPGVSVEQTGDRHGVWSPRGAETVGWLRPSGGPTLHLMPFTKVYEEADAPGTLKSTLAERPDVMHKVYRESWTRPNSVQCGIFTVLFPFMKHLSTLISNKPNSAFLGSLHGE